VHQLGFIFAQLLKGLVPIAFILALGYKSLLFQHSDCSLLAAFFVLFSLDCFAFCFLISSFFSTAQVGR
jgi:hypothetical protein